MIFDIKDGEYRVNGAPAFLMSGEFHYFRVPKEDWRVRLELFREMNGNCVATYVPWRIHEPTEGNIIFGDIGSRDLVSFLELCKEMDLSVIIRPGPLQYSELVDDGLPAWLFDSYPQICAQRWNGKRIRVPSYNHPLFLEKARKYFREFAKIVKPYLRANGGPICFVQVDNEVMGEQIWKNTIDYNRETFGIGKEDGLYATWLIKKYGSIDKLNKAYQKDFSSFAEVFPAEWNEKSSVGDCRSCKDYFDFYLSMTGDYLRTLTEWLYEDGIREYICHNSANNSMNGLFDTIIEKQVDNFLLASDHYYNLDQSWKQNNPTPQSALRVFFSCEQLRNMGMPATAMELAGGSCSDFPPILSEDLEAWYFTNIAMGLKGFNFYIYTGGPNFENSGLTCDIYDFNALVHADGTVNKTYNVAQRFCEFLKQNPWLESAHRKTSVTVAYENEWFCSEYFGYATPIGQLDRIEMVRNGILYSLFASQFAPEMSDISKNIPDIKKPLILCASDAMSKKSQENVVEFLKKGGNLLLFTTVPTLDENYNPCTILKDYIGIEYEKGPYKRRTVVYNENGLKTYNVYITGVCSDNFSLGTDLETGDCVITEKTVGSSHIVFAAFQYYKLTVFSQVQLLCSLLERLDTQPTLIHSNPHIFTSVLEDEEHTAVFLMNLYSGENTTDICGCGVEEKNVVLHPMEVKTLIYPKKL